MAGAALALGAYQWRQRDSEIATVPTVARNPVQPAAAADAPPLAAVPKESRAEQAPDDTLAWPAEVERTRSWAMANAVLFQAWGAPSDEGDACRHAKRVGLRCLTTRGGLDELRKINRPAVMHLSDAQGDYYATLTRLDDLSATLSVGGGSRSVPLDVLAAHWSGHYTVLWRLPPEARDGLKGGARGPGVDWLNRQLARGREEGLAADAVFDEGLVRRVKQFQLAQGLIPDGIIGPQTLMHLTTLSDESAPKLAPALGDKQ
jgi:general secretion pathway protein A